MCVAMCGGCGNAGNNCIQDLKAIQVLKELPKLLILDLSGNPVSDLPESRLYTIYHLRKLKVLDGSIPLLPHSLDYDNP